MYSPSQHQLIRFNSTQLTPTPLKAQSLTHRAPPSTSPRQRNIIPISSQAITIPTDSRLIPTAQLAALALPSRVQCTRRQRIGRPALAAIFEADPLVFPAERETPGDGHVVCGEEQRGQSAGFGGLDEAVVVGEVYVALDDDGAGRGRGGGDAGGEGCAGFCGCAEGCADCWIDGCAGCGRAG